MMLPERIRFGVFLFFFLLAGCAAPKVLPTVMPSITASPSPTMRPTSTATPLPPENILKYQPFEITTDLPFDVNPGGALAIGREPLQRLHFGTQIRLEIVPGLYPESALMGNGWLTLNILKMVRASG
jgi:hypothetical protein